MAPCNCDGVCPVCSIACSPSSMAKWRGRAPPQAETLLRGTLLGTFRKRVRKMGPTATLSSVGGNPLGRAL
eukprot:5443492-Pyramimonas_sp.AAC.1